jgi:hypothetical protein
MNRSTLLWIFSALLTIFAGVYQRVTGPTFPASGKALIEGKEFEYHLARSHGQPTDAPIEFRIDDPSIRGTLIWKLHKTSESVQEIPMALKDGMLRSSLPLHQPATRVQYQIRLETNTGESTMIPKEPAVLRFRGDVPLYVLIPHVMFMFTAMLFSTRAGLEYFNNQPNYSFFVRWTIITLFVGGFAFGPMMTWYAFKAWWTGWPVGTDLTDNKTAFAMMLWLGALFFLKRSKSPGRWVLVAAVGLLLVYLIPHSWIGT